MATNYATPSPVTRIQYFGDFEVVYHQDGSITLHRVSLKKALHFAHGADSARFLDNWDALADAAPGRPVQQIMAAIWEDEA